VGGANYCTTSRNSTSAYLADASHKKVIIHRIKKRVFCGDTYRKRGSDVWNLTNDTTSEQASSGPPADQ